MDVQQLRSWVFELYEPLTEDRTYVILVGRTGTLIDLPPFDHRALLTILGVCDPGVVFFTHAGRARDIARWRDALPGARFAIHQADAGDVEGGVELSLADGDLLTRAPETQVIHIGAHTPGASMALARVPGGVLFTGDAVIGTDGKLSLPDRSYADARKVRAGVEKLRAYEFAAVLSTHGQPLWSAGKERYLQLLDELPRPKRRFGHIADVPWDREYLRVRSQMSANPLVPKAETIAEAAGHGPSTLVPAWERKPARDVAWSEARAEAPAASAPRADGKRWSLATEAPKALPPKPPGPMQTVPWELFEAPVEFRRLTAEEVVAIPHVDWSHRSFDLSRDGRDAVFSWDPTGNFEVYRAPLAGDAIYQLTSGTRSSLQPRISPDGGRIAFLRERDGGLDLWLVDRQGTRESRLTDRPALRSGLSWAPDGATLAYFSDESGSTALHAMELAGGATRVLATDARATHAGPSWSRDGRLLAYHAGDDEESDVYIVRVDGATLPERIETRGGAAARSITPRFAPDAASLAFVTDLRGRWEVAIVALHDGRAAGAPRFLRDGHYDEFDPVWDVEPGRLLYLRSAEATISARRAYLVSYDDEPVLDAPGVHVALHVRPNGDLAYHWSGAREPADVYLKARQEILPRRITRSLPASIPAGLFVEPRHVRYPAPDGMSLPALLYLPHRQAVDGGGGERPPAIVAAHGLSGQHTVLFDEWIQWFANRGYVVLAANVRGSSGYGRAFREASRGDAGGKDLEDLAAGAEWLAREEIADARRIAAFGRSYGGYLALRAAERWPDRFAAVCSLAGRVTPGVGRRAPSPGSRDPAFLRERSVLEAVGALRAPVLLLHGEKDPLVPVEEMAPFVDALRALGKAFSFHVYGGAGHELVRREDRRDALERVIEFFDEHLSARIRAAAPLPSTF